MVERPEPERGADDPVLSTLRAWIRLHLAEPLGIDELAEVAGLARRQLERRCRKVLACSPLALLTAERMAQARTMLLAGNSVADTAAACGYASADRFTVSFKQLHGCPPSRWPAGA